MNKKSIERRIESRSKEPELKIKKRKRKKEQTRKQKDQSPNRGGREREIGERSERKNGRNKEIETI